MLCLFLPLNRILCSEIDFTELQNYELETIHFSHQIITKFKILVVFLTTLNISAVHLTTLNISHYHSSKFRVPNFRFPKLQNKFFSEEIFYEHHLIW